jgi:DNA-binding MurR/RpiR family transcriptional regulator
VAETAPRSLEALKAHLITHHDRFPRRLKQVAVFALDHPREIAFGTAARIAELAGVQPSTLVRFAQAIGYSGFSELQQVFQGHLKGRWTEYSDRVTALREAGEGSGPMALVEGFAASAGVSLARLPTTLSTGNLQAAVDLLAGADTVFLIGVRRVFPVVTYLAYAFGQLGIRCALVDHVGQLGAEQVASATPRDAAIVVSFAPYAPASVDLAGAAAARNVPLIAITDAADSPVAAIARVRLEVVEADFAGFRSLAATMALAMALAVAIAQRRAP